MSNNRVLKIESSRIGGSAGYFIFGIIFLIVGALAAMGGGLASIGTANLFTTLGAGLVAIGFWISLFGKLEERLIDLQHELQRIRSQADS